MTRSRRARGTAPGGAVPAFGDVLEVDERTLIVRIAVFGGSGGTGRQIVEQALGHGHDVVALVHSAPLGITSPRLTEVQGDVLAFDDVSKVVAGADAVASSLGIRRGGSNALISEGTGTIIHAMATHDVQKLAVVSASGAFKRSGSELPLATKIMANTILKSVYEDLERMEPRVQASALTWTIVRPVGLVDGPLTGTYRFTADGSLLQKSSTITRADVAAAVLKALETDLWDRRIGPREPGFQKLRRDDPGVDGVRGESIARCSACELGYEQDVRELARVVGSVAVVLALEHEVAEVQLALVVRHRGHRDHAGLLGGAEHRDEQVREQDRGEVVHSEREFVAVFGQVPLGLVRAGVVDQDVEPVRGFAHLPREVAHLSKRAEVRVDRYPGPA